jgi:glycosyltransferase involved in cell wall biosynthesis
MADTVVSIVMAMYNTRRYVHEAIESVLGQAYPHFELIIVDDGSTDGGHEVVRGYSDPRIRLIRTANHGLSAARNCGVGESRGNYITFLDSDDLLLPMSLCSRITALAQTGTEVAFSRNVVTLEMSSGSASTTPAAISPATQRWIVWEAENLIAKLVQGSFFVFAQSLIMSRRLFEQTRGFDPLIKVYEDVEFLSRLLPTTQHLVETFTPIYVYRRRRDSLSAIGSRRKAAESLRTLRQALRNLAPYLVGREDHVAQLLFNYCVQVYPYWTDEHRRTMGEAYHRRVGPFDLSCVGGQKAKLLARLLGWRAGRLANFASNYLKHNLFSSLRM